MAGQDIPFDALQGRLLPVADMVMVLMWSRPPSGTLRDTRVTIVTIYLAVGVALVGLLLAVLSLALVLTGGSVLWLPAGVLLLLLALGCTDLGLYGIRQRRLMRAS
ncbi:MAG: hypothetical protein ACR2MY_13865 [Candidatus Dormibacteria bacterium]